MMIPETDPTKMTMEQANEVLKAAFRAYFTQLGAEINKVLATLEEDVKVQTPTEDEDKPATKFNVGDRVVCRLHGESEIEEVLREESPAEVYYRMTNGRPCPESYLTLAEEQKKRPDSKFKAGDWVKTTVGYVARIEGEGEWVEDDSRYYYNLRFQDGSSSRRVEDWLEETSMPKPRFQVGDRVQYDAWGGWKNATITKVELDSDNDIRYEFRFDDGETDYDYDFDFGTEHNDALTKLED